MPWQPSKKYCWDFWFVHKDGVLHAFFLQASQPACAFKPSRRADRASVGHAILTDYGWKEINPEQPAFANRDGNHWDNFAIWTGSILEENGLYYMFYTSRCKQDPICCTPQERQRPQNIGIAESKDLTHWYRTAESHHRPVIPNPGMSSPFDGVNWRDPYVIKDEVKNEYFCFVCARPKEGSTEADGLIAYVSSSDIKTWGANQNPCVLVSSEEFYQMEVPQVFWRKNNKEGSWRLYCLFSPQEKDASSNCADPHTGTYYFYSKPIFDRENLDYGAIEWQNKSAVLLADNLFAGKFVNPDSTENPVFFGFEFEDEKGDFSGGISDPKWARFNEDGEIVLHEHSMHTSG